MRTKRFTARSAGFLIALTLVGNWAFLNQFAIAAPANKPQGVSDRVAQGNYERGIEALDRSDFSTAVQLLRLAVESDPKSAIARDALGRAYLASGQSDRALVEFEQAVALNPGFAEAHFHLGKVRELRKETDGAIRAYEEAIRLRPEWAEAHDALGFALSRQGNLVGAQRAFEAASRLKPDLAEARYHLGMTHWLLHNFDAAILELQQAVRLRPKFAAPATILGLPTNNETEWKMPSRNWSRPKS